MKGSSLRIRMCKFTPKKFNSIGYMTQSYEENLEQIDSFKLYPFLAMKKVSATLKRSSLQRRCR
jgi:hypothetical protein